MVRLSVMTSSSPLFLILTLLPGDQYLPPTHFHARCHQDGTHRSVPFPTPFSSYDPQVLTPISTDLASTRTSSLERAHRG
jgi:hypothetical protein